MHISYISRRWLPGERAAHAGAGIVRSVVAWAFIALVALFFTHPSGEPASLFEQPIRLPAELGLEPGPPWWPQSGP